MQEFERVRRLLAAAAASMIVAGVAWAQDAKGSAGKVPITTTSEEARQL